MCRIRSCCCCVDHVEGAKVTGIAFFVANCIICIEQIIVFSVPGVIIQLVLGIASICLIHGAVRRKRSFLLAWIVAYAIAVLALLAYELYSAISEDNELYFIIIVVAVPVMLYALLVIFSLYKRLGNPEDEISGYISV